MQENTVSLSGSVLRYADQMAYASLEGTVDQIRAVVDCPPRPEDLTGAVAIKYIQEYGISLVNMRATNPYQRYPISPQSPPHYSPEYRIYQASMDRIVKSRKERADVLETRVDPLSYYVERQREYMVRKNSSPETYPRTSSADSASPRETVKPPREEMKRPVNDWDCIVS